MPLDFEKYTNSKLYLFFDYLYKLIFINLFWFMATLIGLGVFTFMPAVITSYILLASVQHEQEFPLFRSFIIIFKKIYLRSQKLFLVLTFLGFILIFNLNFFYKQFITEPTSFNFIGLLITFFLFVGMVFTFLYTPMIAIYFPKLSVKDTLKLSLLSSIGMLFHTLLLVGIIVLLTLLILRFPIFFPLLPLCSFSLIAYFFLFITREKLFQLTKGTKPLLVTDFIT